MILPSQSTEREREEMADLADVLGAAQEISLALEKVHLAIRHAQIKLLPDAETAITRLAGTSRNQLMENMIRRHVAAREALDEVLDLTEENINDIIQVISTIQG